MIAWRIILRTDVLIQAPFPLTRHAVRILPLLGATVIPKVHHYPVRTLGPGNSIEALATEKESPERAINRTMSVTNSSLAFKIHPIKTCAPKS